MQPSSKTQPQLLQSVCWGFVIIIIIIIIITIVIVLVLVLVSVLVLFHYLALCTGRSYTDFLPIERLITDDQRFMVLLSISCVLKNMYFPILLHSFSPVQFLEQFPSSSFVHLPFFPLWNHPNPLSTNLIRSLKPSLIYELSLAKLFSAVMQCL